MTYEVAPVGRQLAIVSCAETGAPQADYRLTRRGWELVRARTLNASWPKLANSLAAIANAIKPLDSSQSGYVGPCAAGCGQHLVGRDTCHICEAQQRALALQRPPKPSEPTLF